jgi:hypothetical protein
MTHFLDAISFTPDVHRWLANTRQPRILHIFDRACNLINERREVLSIVTPQIGNGPFNLVLENDFCFSEHINLQSQISISSDQLHLGNLTIRTTDVNLWNPGPDWARLHAKKDTILKQLVSQQMQGFSSQHNFSDHKEIASSQPTLLATTSAQLPLTNYQAISNLSSAIASANLPSSLSATQNLAGLGIGLTPAGDDFIMGAIYAAWIIHPLEIASALAQEIANTAAPLTTSLSAAWLRSAGKGEAGIVWHEFLNALVAGNTSAIQLQMTKLLSIGHTSGADALAGFVGVFTCWVEMLGTSS